jgi:hypothetical protein
VLKYPIKEEDTLATALHAGFTVEGMINLDLGYVTAFEHNPHHGRKTDCLAGLGILTIVEHRRKHAR